MFWVAFLKIKIEIVCWLSQLQSRQKSTEGNKILLELIKFTLLEEWFLSLTEKVTFEKVLKKIN